MRLHWGRGRAGIQSPGVHSRACALNRWPQIQVLIPGWRNRWGDRWRGMFSRDWDRHPDSEDVIQRAYDITEKKY